MSRESTHPPVAVRTLVGAVVVVLVGAAVLLVSTVGRLAALRRALERLVDLAGPLNTAAHRITDALPAADQRADTP